MFVLVLAAEADETRQAITLLIVCLVLIAALLSALTIWYWRHTSPKRQIAAGVSEVDALLPAELLPGSELLSDAELLAASKLLSEAELLVSAEPSPESELVSAGPSAHPESALSSEVQPEPKVEPVAGTAAVTVEVGTLPEHPSSPVTDSESAADEGRSEPRIEVPDRTAGVASMVARIEVGDRCNTGSGAGRGRATGRTAAPPPSPGRTRNKDEDELSEARRRRERQKEVLSDDDWNAIMKSAFEKMCP